MQRDRTEDAPTPTAGWYLNRRGLLHRLGWAVAAAGLSRVPALAVDSVSPAMARLSSYMSEARDRALPDEVVEKAKHHIPDTFAATTHTPRHSRILASPWSQRPSRLGNNSGLTADSSCAPWCWATMSGRAWC